MGMTALLLEEKGYTGAQFMQQLGDIVVWITSIAGAFMVLYAVYIAYLFATASDANKRKAARERLIKIVASALIIVALAAVLSVIKVTFNTQEGRITDPSVGNGINKSDYVYNAKPTMIFIYTPSPNSWEFTGTIVGTFSLDSKFLEDKDQKIDPEGNLIQFQECRVVAPNNWLDNEGTSVLNNSAIGQATFQYTITNFIGIKDIPCNKKDGQPVITVSVKFVFTEDTSKVYTSTFDVAVDSQSDNIVIK